MNNSAILALRAQNIILANSGILSTRHRHNDLSFELKDGAQHKTVYADAIHFVPGYKTGFYVTVLTKSYFVSDEDLNRTLSYICENYLSPDKKELTDEELALRVKIRRLNLSFIAQHGDITEGDFALIDEHRNAMLEERLFPDGKVTPKQGDLVEGAYYGGKFPFKNGAIVSNSLSADKLCVCAEPYTPCVYQNDNEVNVNCSGGPFFSFKEDELEFVGSDTRLVCDWGHAGACANGSIQFPVTVNRWRIKDGIDY